MSSSDYETYKANSLTQKYKEIEWANLENLFKFSRPKNRSPHSISETIPVSLVLDIRLKLSCFGRFMKHFNEDQIHNFFWNENNFGIEFYNYMNMNKVETSEWAMYNDFTDNILELLKKGVQTTKVLEYDFFYNNLKTLRLINGPINKVDSLAKYKHLEVLILATNWIKQVKGKNLPPNLQYLECFANEIKSVKGICSKYGPQRIKYLGLARNLLDESSSLYLLATSRTFTELKVLDLGNNDIKLLTRVLDELSALESLTSLALEGNPCYVCHGYKENVICHLPNLLYLDGTQILPEDRPNVSDLMYLQHLATKGTFIFTCYRIVGLSPPPKNKAAEHSYYLEIDLPLLEPVKPPSYAEMQSKSTQIFHELLVKSKYESSHKFPDSKGSKKAPKEDKHKTQKSKVDIKIKAVDTLGHYSLPNEIDIVENEYSTFRSQEKSWSKIIKFEEPTITIDIPLSDFHLLRDTFRSRIRIKLIYVQKQYTKSSKKKSKTSKAATETKISHISLNKSVSDVSDIEKVVKRSTLATFYCHLQPVNWSDAYLDFIWTDQDDFGKDAVVVEGSLKHEIYDEKSSTANSKRSKHGSKRLSNAKSPLPKSLTLNLGFGMQRYLKQEVFNI